MLWILVQDDRHQFQYNIPEKIRNVFFSVKTNITRLFVKLNFHFGKKSISRILKKIILKIWTYKLFIFGFISKLSIIDLLILARRYFGQKFFDLCTRQVQIHGGQNIFQIFGLKIPTVTKIKITACQQKILIFGDDFLLCWRFIGSCITGS